MPNYWPPLTSPSAIGVAKSRQKNRRRRRRRRVRLACPTRRAFVRRQRRSSYGIIAAAPAVRFANRLMTNKKTRPAHWRKRRGRRRPPEVWAAGDFFPVHFPCLPLARCATRQRSRGGCEAQRLQSVMLMTITIVRSESAKNRTRSNRNPTVVERVAICRPSVPRSA